MARSVASTHLAPPAAAAWTWAAVGAALLAMPVSRPPQPMALRPVAAHEPVAASPWEGAERVYEELDRRFRHAPAPARDALARLIVEEAARAEVAPLLVLAVIQVESGFDVRAVSPVGAVGLMQLMPPTLREELALASLRATDPFEPAANVRAGIRYLGKLIATFSDLELALMAYNAGPGRIRRHLEAGGVPERFLGYPRDVLRVVERMGVTIPGPRTRPARARRAPAAAHATRPAPPGAEPTALHHLPGPLAAEILAAVEASAAAVAEAVAAIDLSRLPVPPAPTRANPERRACVRDEPALPMSRGRERPRPLERALPS
jgi:Transglycosylase SLT domain